MDIEEMTAAFAVGQATFDQSFESKIVNAKQSSVQRKPTLYEKFKSYQQRATGSDLRSDSWTDAQLATGKYALSNMLGSMSFMHGDRMVLSSDGLVVKQKDATLFTAVPDRPDHARGFMWDEGFHQHLISVWNMDLTMDIIESWFAQTDQTTGWICREQMLGREIRAGAPPSSWA